LIVILLDHLPRSCNAITFDDQCQALRIIRIVRCVKIKDTGNFEVYYVERSQVLSRTGVKQFRKVRPILSNQTIEKAQYSGLMLGFAHTFKAATISNSLRGPFPQANNILYFSTFLLLDTGDCSELNR